ncbi:MAG TPA: YfiR family protein [Candidatus Saccharimonadales bacterium]|nr:YfiR family protein [Candidatus Saccharimonadales bacterium]
MKMIDMQGQLGRRRVFAVASLLIASLAMTVAQESGLVANKVKAAMVYNFTKYVEWPASSFPAPTSPLVIGVIGKDPIMAEIDSTLKGKAVEKRVLAVRQFSDVAEARGCHVVFICASERKRLPKILEQLKKENTLTVSDLEGFVEEGGMIGFRKEANTIRFDINQSTAEKAGLKVSSKLLQLARAGRGDRGSVKP